jgi:hypothetical protein
VVTVRAGVAVVVRGTTGATYGLSLGVARCGNWAIGTLSAGIVTERVGAWSCIRTAPAAAPR